MNVGGAAEARILHVSPGRVRIHLPGWAPCEREALENQVRQLAGVRQVHANSWTGNVLILFDPKATRPTTLLTSCCRVAAPQSLPSPAPQIVPAANTGRVDTARWLELAKVLFQLGAFLAGFFVSDRVNLVVGGAETLLRLGGLIASRPALATASS